ncbi:SRPBCC family protein [Streptomyces sp. FXJ1.172]|uniref:SRPBCC family protein n=1 Tax=Streptomyces sp. FXJ1.172 TaxID=710705 RepID=UPI0007D0132B|nr:SRPBCC family protein [Streptomyces sp. FXJ1.172]WEO95243.1 SRPBCC family protein [Streptomyces sp. FXJ1.172]
MGLGIETHIRADLDTLWARTQDPEAHRRWDLRFTAIEELPGAEGEPRRFTCTARVLPFLTVSGTGYAADDTDRPDGTRTSAVRFSSPHPLSLIAEASGYWRYVPDADGVRLLTGFDYRPRWGAFGAVADRVLFRPLTGWATAWSLDRLRLWLERGITPERALANWAAELVVRALLLTVCLTGLGLEPLLRLSGPFADAVAYLCPLLLVVAISLALFKAPLGCTPAARRCPRECAGEARAPRVLRMLEQHG